MIDDPAIAGDKAFNWKKEFPQVFEKGGFDVVIETPPYVFARDNFRQIEKDFFVEQYLSAKYQLNTYILFIERTVSLLRQKGAYGLTIPNAWLMVYSGEALRKFLLENCTLSKIINLEGFSFENVNVETVILLASKQKVNQNLIEIFLNNGKEFYFSHSKQQLDFQEEEGFELIVFSDDESKSQTSKLRKNSIDLDKISNIKSGLKAYQKGKGSPKQSEEEVNNRPYDYDYKFDDKTFPYLEVRDIGRYFMNWTGKFLQFGKFLAEPRQFLGEKIIVREITGTFPKSIIANFTTEDYLFNMSNIAITPKEGNSFSLRYVLSILSSTLLSYYFVKNTAKSVRKLFPKIILNDLRKFPIKNIPLEQQNPFIEKANVMLSLNKELQELSGKFQRNLEREFSLETLSKKLQNWYDLSYDDFLKELKKQKVELSLSQKADWEHYFDAEKNKAQQIQSQISSTDKEIDKMVYELYGLTEEEIAIVEKG